jgi:5-formyltetrahydrofolate cyclo-ligase
LNSGPPPPAPEADLAAAKRRLRRAVRRDVLAMDPAARRAAEDDLRAGLAAVPGWREAGTVLLYVDVFPDEIATGPLLGAVLDSGRRLVLPRVDRDAWRLRLHAIDDLGAGLVRDRMGLLEPRPDAPEVAPEAVDLAVVPGVAFDPEGYRLGRGGGLYDRLLPRLRPDAPRWALALPPQLVAAVPVEPHDQRLDGIVLPGRTIRPPGRKSPPPGGFLIDFPAPQGILGPIAVARPARGRAGENA